MTTTFVFVPGAGGQAWYWHRVVGELERRGHAAIAVDLPTDDDTAGLTAYADTVVAAIGDRAPVVLVAQSLGGLAAPLVRDRVPGRDRGRLVGRHGAGRGQGGARGPARSPG